MPIRRSACAISTPTGPPPSTSSLSGSSPGLKPVTSRFVQTPSSSRSPSIGGITGSEPVAITMSAAVWVSPPTSIVPGATIRPSPRMMSIPFSCAHLTAPESS